MSPLLPSPAVGASSLTVMSGTPRFERAFDALVAPVPPLFTAIVGMRLLLNVPFVMMDAGRSGMRAVDRTPVICVAAMLNEVTGSRASAMMPDVIFVADRFGIRPVRKRSRRDA